MTGTTHKTPPPSVKTDRQRREWYWRQWRAAEERGDVVTADAMQTEFEWYSALTEETP